MKSLDAIGNAPSLSAPSQNASLSARILIVNLKLPAAAATEPPWDKPPSFSSKKLKRTLLAAHAIIDNYKHDIFKCLN